MRQEISLHTHKTHDSASSANPAKGQPYMKWRMFFYLSGFVCLLLALLWLFQTVLLDDFYKFIKTQAIENVADDAESRLGEESYQSYLDDLSAAKDLSLAVFNTKGVLLFESSMMAERMIPRLTIEAAQQAFKTVDDAGGEWMQQFDTEQTLFPDMQIKSDFNRGDRDRNRPGFEFLPDLQRIPPNLEQKPGIMLARTAELPSGEKVMILITGFIVPVDSTVETLRLQLLAISVIFLLMSGALALILSKRLSTPIMKLNQAAKILAKGDFSASFHAEGYREIVELSDTLNYASRELSKVDNLRKELIANISHDLRTPLTMITGYAEVMRDLPGENSPENLQVIIEESQRLSTLVSGILDLSRLQSGAQELNLQQVSITQIIKSIVDRYCKFTEQEGFDIRFTYTEDIQVLADEVRISQVVYNLLQNAVAYTGDNKTIRLTQTRVNGRVRIEIADSGMGIPEDQLPHIWDRYYKGDKAHQRTTAGSGLGLSIVKAVLDRHNGSYGATSELGMGTTFWFDLPTV